MPIPLDKRGNIIMSESEKEEKVPSPLWALFALGILLLLLAPWFTPWAVAAKLLYNASTFILAAAVGAFIKDVTR